MAEAAANVVAGEVVEAVRDATSPAGPVRRGDYVGITREGIVVVAPSVVDAACALLELLVADHHEIVTILEGTGASDKGTRRISDWLSRERPAVTAEVHQGDQPLSAYLFSVE
jgi:dihydroxyacetone kinase-like predicted kinase